MDAIYNFEYKGVMFDVEYYHQPEEKQILHCGDGSGYEGCSESVELSDIKLNGVSLMLPFEECQEDIESEILTYLKNQDDV